jgi:hypothetical protein
MIKKLIETYEIESYTKKNSTGVKNHRLITTKFRTPFFNFQQRFISVLISPKVPILPKVPNFTEFFSEKL